jgi:putative ABC transport system permease protein
VLTDLLLRLRALFKGTAVDREIDDELRFHMDRQIESYKRAGLDDVEAARRVRLEFGGVDQIKEEYRDALGVRILDDLWRDLRLAIRSLAATPVVSLVAGLSLALGIGANTAIFSIINGLLLRPLPVERPDRLVLLLSNPSVNPSSPWSNPVWEQIRDHHADLFETTFAFSRRTTRFNLAQGGQTDFVDGIYASGQYFEGLRVRPIRGRSFTVEDDRREGGPSGPVAVISFALWQRRFGGSPDVIGKVQTVDRVPFTIVGVIPPDFFGTDVGSMADVILPIGTEPLIRGRDSMLDRVTTSSLLMMARLKDGQTVIQAEQAMRAVQPQIREATMPTNVRAEVRTRYLATPFGVQPAAGGPSAMRSRYRQPLLVIMTVVALVLLVASANVANLFLARAAARRHEFSVRLALGASRWRLAHQQLVESLVLSAAGCVVGLVMAKWASALLIRELSTQANSVFLDTHLDWRVLTFTASVASAVALIFGTVPALRASRTEPIEAIRERGRSTVGLSRLDVGAALVAGQVALSLVLVVAAGLFIRTFTTLATLNVGFDRDPVLLVRLDVPPTSTDPSQRSALYERVAATVRAAPGAAHAAISEITPVSGMITDDYVEVENGPPLAPPQNITCRNVITPDWFTTYGTRLLAGRDFNDRDQVASPPVAIVNETFARRFLPGGNPLGRRIRNPSSAPGETRPWITVVGVVADATYLSLREVVPATMYVPLAQQDVTRSFSFVSLSVRAANGSPATLVRGVAAAIARVDPDIAITFTPLRQQVDAALVQERIMAMLSGFFGTLALLLAGIGLYGVTAYAVARRRTEIGIRIALGAIPGSVVQLVVARVAMLVGIGAVAGTAASLWLSRFVATLVYGVEPSDPTTLVGATVVLAAVATAAASFPAARAARIDPAAVLRES